MLTVNATLLEVTGDPQVLLTTQSYPEPAATVFNEVKLVRLKVADVAPETPLPLLKFTPFKRH